MKYEEHLNTVKGKLFINGKYIDSNGGKLFDVINPATETKIYQAAAASESDVNDAVDAARNAFDNGEWRKIDDYQRAKMLYKFAELIEQNADWLAYFETLNNGKPLLVSKNEDVPFTAQIYRYFAGQADKIKGKTLPMSKPFFGMTKK